MTNTEGLTIVAILLGPLIAVQLTRYLDDRKERRQRKLAVFRELMATRARSLSQVHVEALNRIEMEFKEQRGTDTAVRSAWREYLGHLNDRTLTADRWEEKRVDLLVALLEVMGRSVGYHFDRAEIKSGIYSPEGHGRVEQEYAIIRAGLAKVFEGTASIPVVILPVPPVPPPASSPTSPQPPVSKP